MPGYPGRQLKCKYFRYIRMSRQLLLPLPEGVSSLDCPAANDCAAGPFLGSPCKPAGKRTNGFAPGRPSPGIRLWPILWQPSSSNKRPASKSGFGHRPILKWSSAFHFWQPCAPALSRSSSWNAMARTNECCAYRGSTTFSERAGRHGFMNRWPPFQTSAR